MTKNESEILLEVERAMQCLIEIQIKIYQKNAKSKKLDQL
jgi:hypothetical protein